MIAVAVVAAGAAFFWAPLASAAAAPLSSGPGNHATAQAPGIQYPCSPLAEGDYVHISSTAPLAASGHGWWLDNGCNESYGYVCITLQEKLSGTWYNEAGPNCKSLPPGKKYKVGARKDCITNRSEYWRSHVTVSTSGAKGYGSGSKYTPEQYIGCTA